MGGHMSKQEDMAVPIRALQVTHGAVFGGLGLVAIGWYFGKEDADATLALKMMRWGGFGLLFGSQVWNSFISGIVLLKTLPMHTFGEVQTYMFPAYFNTTIFVSAASIGLHLYLHPISTWTKCERMVTKAMTTTLLCSFINMTVLLERNLRVMNSMFAIEKEVGVGQQIGRPNKEQRAILDKDPNYTEMRSKFGRWHGLSSLVNMVGLGGSIMHLVYLSQHGP